LGDLTTTWSGNGRKPGLDLDAISREGKMSGFIRGPDIRALRQRGFSLGTHGTTHRALTLMPREQCLAELVESKPWKK
jgi:peptidoglycan/xylan/chitin deacetylase (PgdA/CDA1 family)